MRKLMVLVGILLTVAVVMATSQFQARRSESLPRTVEGLTTNKSSLLPRKIVDPPGTIDGALRPDLIPDELAYSLFFSFVASQRDNKRDNLDSYLQQNGLSGIDVDTLIKFANDFQVAYMTIDAEQKALSAQKDQRGRSVELLTKLKNRKTELMNEKVKQLPSIIGMRNAETIRQHVLHYVRRKVKILPSLLA